MEVGRLAADVIGGLAERVPERDRRVTLLDPIGSTPPGAFFQSSP
jgi:hypothetical protein